MISLLEQLTGPQAYTAPCAELSNASIGEHTRHVIELYQCLLAGYEKGEVNYDARKRNKLYENDRAEAIATGNPMVSRVIRRIAGGPWVQSGALG